jgi:hypothetical protein
LLAGFAQDGDYSCENLRPGGPEKPQLDVFSLVQSSDDWRLTLTPTHNRYFMEFNGIFCTEFHEYENLMFVFSREIHYLGNRKKEIPSGKRLDNYGKSTIFNWKTHYVYGHFQ